MENKILNLKGHTIVCGYGRMGEIICNKLASEGVTFVVIEKNKELIEMLKKTKFWYIEGDAANDDTLTRASINNADVLVSVIDNDSDGLYIALAGRSFNPNLQIIVRANEVSAEKRMIRAGANKVILPFVMSGLKVAESVINPTVEDFFNFPDMHGSDGESIQISDLYISNKSTITHKTLREVGPDIEGLIIIGIRKNNSSFTFNPRGDYKFEEKDCLIVMGEPSAHKQVRLKFDLEVYAPYTNENVA